MSPRQVELEVGRSGVPVVMDVDIGHTVPMFTVAQDTMLRVVAPAGEVARLFVLEDMVQ